MIGEFGMVLGKVMQALRVARVARESRDFLLYVSEPEMLTAPHPYLVDRRLSCAVRVSSPEVNRPFPILARQRRVRRGPGTVC